MKFLFIIALCLAITTLLSGCNGNSKKEGQDTGSERDTQTTEITTDSYIDNSTDQEAESDSNECEYICAINCECKQDNQGCDLPECREPRGDCTEDNTCGTGHCEAIPDHPDGWFTCINERLYETDECSPDGDHQCCSSSECTSGINGGCFEGPLWYCGGMMPIPSNVCLYDQCTDDEDCTEHEFGLCLPAGAFNELRKHCVYGGCIFNRDCSSGSGGECLPFFDPCHRRFTGFHCVYDDSDCKRDSDCEGDEYCQPGEDGQTSCQWFAHPP